MTTRLCIIIELNIYEIRIKMIVEMSITWHLKNSRFALASNSVLHTESKLPWHFLPNDSFQVGFIFLVVLFFYYF